MFYLHEAVDYDEIANGATIHIDLAEEEFHCTCPRCGTEVIADAHDLCESLVLTEDRESAYCPDCSKKLLAEREADTDDGFFLSDTLIEELIDGTRDENGAQRFVYLRDKGIIVDIERCTDLDLIKAANQQLTEKLAEAQEEFAKAHRRMTELEDEWKKYRVVWCNHEGNEEERWFSTARDAIHESVSLESSGYEGVQVFDADGNPV